MRRAVIIVDSIDVFVCLMALGSLIGAMRALRDKDIREEVLDMFDDDEVAEAMTDAHFFTVTCILVSIKMFASVIGIIGAVKFSICLTVIAVLAYLLQITVALIGFINVPVLIYAAFFLYPHFVFIKEVKQGIMSKENYHNEEASCCCV